MKANATMAVLNGAHVLLLLLLAWMPGFKFTLLESVMDDGIVVIIWNTLANPININVAKP